MVLAPPVTLLELAHSTTEAPPNSTISAPLRFASASHKTLRGTIAFEWSLPAKAGATDPTCGLGAESQVIDLACAGSTIKSIPFAEYGTPSGDCSGISKLSLGKCGANATAAISSFVSKCCVGKESCSVSCEAASKCTCVGGPSLPATTDPCFGTAKYLGVMVSCAAAPPTNHGATVTMKVSIPTASDSQLVVPLLGSAVNSVIITEGGTPIFKMGAYVHGVEGITGASVVGSTIVVTHGSGDYVSFESITYNQHPTYCSMLSHKDSIDMYVCSCLHRINVDHKKNLQTTQFAYLLVSRACNGAVLPLLMRWYVMFLSSGVCSSGLNSPKKMRKRSRQSSKRSKATKAIEYQLLKVGAGNRYLCRHP